MITKKLIYAFILVFLSLPLLTTNSGLATNSITLQNSNNISIVQKIDRISSTNSIQTQPTLQSSTGTGSWQELGPMPLTNPNGISGWGSAPYSGRVTAIAVNGSNPNEIFVGTAQGGVWKTLDGGNTWIPLMDQQNSLAVGSIALSPDNSTLYVGTGEPNHSGDSYYGIGLLKSTDGGNSWTTLGANYFNDSAISSIIINKTNPNDILVSTTYAVDAKGLVSVENPNGLGIFLSTDGGVSWVNTLSSSYGIADMVANATNSNTIFAGDFQGAIWESTDSGNTWSKFPLSVPTSDQGRVALAVTPANPSYLYAVFSNSTGDLYIEFSYDFSTKTFNQFGALPPLTTAQYGPCSNQCYYNLFIQVDPTNNNTIYLGTNNLYKSTDGGNTWSFLGGAQWNGPLHPDQHTLAFSPTNPNVIYSGNDGGIYESTDGGSSWNSLNTNLGTLQFTSIAASPTNDAHLIGGVQDNACDIYTNSTSWTYAAGGDGAASLFISDSAMACNYVNLDPRISVDNGYSFIDIQGGLNQSDNSQFYAPMVQDPNNPSTLFLGSNRIYKLTSASGTWSDLSGNITNSKISITSIAIAKTNSNIMYEGDSQGIVKVSTNGGSQSTWNTILTTNNSIPITSVAVDPFDSAIVYVSIASQTNPRLLVSDNQGSSWSYVNLAGVPNVAIDVVKFNPVTGVLFIGTDRGLYYLNNAGQWDQLGSGLPNAAVYDFTFTASNYLVVGTHGRGVWLNYITPFITLNTLMNNSYYRSGTQAGITIQDPNGYTNPTYHWDSASPTTAPPSFTVNLPSGDGQHILYVSAKDITGNWANITFVFNVDNTSPTIALPASQNNTLIIGSSLNVLISDKSPLQSIQYNWNGTSNSTAILNSGEITIIVPTGNGKATLYVYAEDAASNWASKDFIFTIQPIPTTAKKSVKTPGFEVGVFLIAVGFLLFTRRRKVT